MNRYRFELILATALSMACAAVWYWQEPGDRLTQAEVTRYLETIDKQVPLPADEKADALARLRAFGDNDRGQPVYMINLMRHYDKLRADAGIPSDFAGTPAEANAHYESNVFPLALKSGSLPIFVGNVRERNVTTSADDEDGWSRVGVMRYPNRHAFFELLTDPVYAKYLPYKLGALHVALVPSDSEILMPDLRFLTVVVALVVFLAAGWLRAARRATD